MAWYSGGVQHWTVTPFAYDHGGCVRQVDGIRTYHKSQEWTDIAYNDLVCYHGLIIRGRGAHRPSGANGSTATNQTHLALAYLGGPGLPFTQEARTAARNYWYGKGLQGKVIPHRSITGSECPGNEIIKWIHDGMPSGKEGLTVAQYDELKRLIFLTGVSVNLEQKRQGDLTRKAVQSAAGAVVEHVREDLKEAHS